MDFDKALEENYKPRLISGITASRLDMCDRKMWFKYRGVKHEVLTAETLRTFEIGHALENSIVGWIEAAGFKVAMRESEIKNKYGRTLAKIDGIAVKDGVFYLLEMKTAKDSRYKDMIKNGIPDYYMGQIQVEMHESAQLSKKGNQLTECLYVILNKNTGELFAHVIKYDKTIAEMWLNKAYGAMESEAMPEGANDWKCKMCEFKTFCNGGELPNINCRTCANVSVKDGEFFCDQAGGLLKDHTACKKHIFHPQLMALNGYEVKSVDHENLCIYYQDFANAPEGYKTEKAPTMSSREIELLIKGNLLADDNIKNLVHFAKAEIIATDDGVPF